MQLSKCLVNISEIVVPQGSLLFLKYMIYVPGLINEFDLWCCFSFAYDTRILIKKLENTINTQ